MMHGTHNVTLTHCNMMHGTHNVKSLKDFSSFVYANSYWEVHEPILETSVLESDKNDL